MASSGRHRGLTDAFRAAGFPGERAVLPFDDVLEQRDVTCTGNVDRISPTRRAGVGLGADERFAWPAFGRIAVDSATTAVDVLSQTARTLAAATDTIRAIDSVTPNPGSQ